MTDCTPAVRRSLGYTSTILVAKYMMNTCTNTLLLKEPKISISLSLTKAKTKKLTYAVLCLEMIMSHHIESSGQSTELDPTGRWPVHYKRIIAGECS